MTPIPTNNIIFRLLGVTVMLVQETIRIMNYLLQPYEQLSTYVCYFISTWLQA